MLLVTSVLWGCGGEQKPPQDAVVNFVAAAERAGYIVQTGAFEYSTYENCCNPGASCLWNNPTTPYGAYALPPAPGPHGTVSDPGTDGLLRLYHLRSDEAIVLLTKTPPQAKYFSWRSYLGLRFEPDGVKAVLGSLGPSLNNLVVAERMGTSAIFEQPFAVVTTADQVVEAQVASLLMLSGWQASTIHPDRIPHSLVRMGLDDEDDLFQGVSRVAVYTDQAAGDAYLADPEATLLRLTPVVETFEPVRPHPVARLPGRGSGQTEEAWIAAVQDLADALVSQYADSTPTEAVSNAWHFETYDCITQDAYCSGEIRDRYYARVPNFKMPDNNVFAVAFGVNHERAGKASYATVALDSVFHQIGIDSIDSDQFVGSARPFLPDHPLVDDLFAVTIARECGSVPGLCIPVPYGCPGIEPNEPLLVSFRAYLEPATGAAPLPAELVPSRVLVFTPPTVPTTTL